MSGGQRQLIGIARALYKRSQVLVVDEATSALDTGFDQALMDAVNLLSKDLIIIMVAHRLSTLRQCDQVIKLEQRTFVADGPPQLVLAT